MLYIPFFSRLSLSEYQGLLAAALFFIVEKLLRILLLVVPINLVVDHLPEWVFSWFKIPQLLGTNKEAEGEFLDDFNSFAEIMEYWGYSYEDHLVETRDGFLLGIHRINGPRGRRAEQSTGAQPTDAPDSASLRMSTRINRPVVLFWHGFMLSSECFVCHPDWINILPFRLAEAGYDVWLGNSRGNKYSYKHLKLTPDDRRFWDFSIDEIATIDVPTTVDFILKETGAPNLTYIGFSQGTAQMFMALARNKSLNSQVSRFIALAPASTPRGFHNSIVDYFTKATPQMLYLMFGRRRAMSLVYFWINLLPRDLYVAALDFCVHLLFGWTMRNLSQETKCIVYWHLYSYTSVKAIVHWMQIIRCGKLQMYDDDPPVYPLFWTSDDPKEPVAGLDFKQAFEHSRPQSIPLSARSAKNRGYQRGVLTHWNNDYPLKKISTRISLFYGGSDSLSSVELLCNDLAVTPEERMCFQQYEHMDFLWADTVGMLVYPKVLALMGVSEDASRLPMPELTLAAAQENTNTALPHDSADSTGSINDELEDLFHNSDGHQSDVELLGTSPVGPTSRSSSVLLTPSAIPSGNHKPTLSRRRLPSISSVSSAND
ncbi:cholesterol esterase [Coemansia sp. RSA 1646]|nr:cholesterol esterase [Coemansia sp. RSA 1646]KAJ2093755.1 cholesterol esterase [Coemansia sp. RSA 986]